MSDYGEPQSYRSLAVILSKKDDHLINCHPPSVQITDRRPFLSNPTLYNSDNALIIVSTIDINCGDIFANTPSWKFEKVDTSGFTLQDLGVSIILWARVVNIAQEICPFRQSQIMSGP